MSGQRGLLRNTVKQPDLLGLRVCTRSRSLQHSPLLLVSSRLTWHAALGTTVQPGLTTAMSRPRATTVDTSEDVGSPSLGEPPPHGILSTVC